MSINDSFHIYDTTLRDGAQQEGLNLSVHDKLSIARHLDDLGVGFIEGGWPGANPKDTQFFKLAQTELKLKNATFVAFGATRRAPSRASRQSTHAPPRAKYVPQYRQPLPIKLECAQWS